MRDDLAMRDSKEACPLCGSTELYQGYGLAAGPGIGFYRICLDCDGDVDKEIRVDGSCLHSLPTQLETP